MPTRPEAAVADDVRDRGGAPFRPRPRPARRRGRTASAAGAARQSRAFGQDAALRRPRPGARLRPAGAWLAAQRPAGDRQGDARLSASPGPCLPARTPASAAWPGAGPPGVPPGRAGRPPRSDRDRGRARPPHRPRSSSEIPVDAVRAATAALHDDRGDGRLAGGRGRRRRAAQSQCRQRAPEVARGAAAGGGPAPDQPSARRRSPRPSARAAPSCALARLPDALVTEAPGALAAGAGRRAARRARAARPRQPRPRAGHRRRAACLPSYRRLAPALGAAPGIGLALHELAGALARHAEQRGFAGPLGLVQELLGRVIAAGQRPPRPGAVRRTRPRRSRAWPRAVPLIAGRGCGTRSPGWRPPSTA